MARSRASCGLLVIAFAAALVATASAQDNWVTARATFYGRDNWPLHNGACGFGFICPNRWNSELAEGYDVAAISDRSNLNTGSQCGTCLEIRCRDGSFTDGDGAFFDRSGLCLNKAQSVKVKITDMCPCNYPANAASNKRWCCNDMPHLDVSIWALEKLVSDPTRWGVFAIDYRTIPCDASISDPAPPPSYVAPDPHADMKPAGLNCASQSDGAVTAYAASSARRATIPKARHSTHRHTAAWYRKPMWLRLKQAGRRLLAATESPQPTLQLQMSNVINHENSAWTPALSGKASWISKRPSEANESPIGRSAKCCTAPARGDSCGFSAAAGEAELATTLGWYYQRHSAADKSAVSVAFVADKKVCDGPVIKELGEGPQAGADDWDYYKLPLSEAIGGCTTEDEVTGVRFTNEGDEPAQFCVDHVMLL